MGFADRPLRRHLTPPLRPWNTVVKTIVALVRMCYCQCVFCTSSAHRFSIVKTRMTLSNRWQHPLEQPLSCTPAEGSTRARFATWAVPEAMRNNDTRYRNLSLDGYGLLALSGHTHLYSPTFGLVNIGLPATFTSGAYF